MRFLSRLDDQQCQKMHEGSLRVLERTGLIVEEPEALELLANAGAEVDGTLVKIPEKLVDWALKVKPNSVTLYGRDGEPALRCGGNEYSFGAGSDCMHIIDHRTGERRRAALSDVEEAARVQDACENLDFLMSLFSPSDVNPDLMDRYQMAAMLKNSSKPIVYVTFDDPHAHVDLTEMAEAVVGGRKAMAERPMIACYKAALFPLRFNQGSVRTLLDLAEWGQPCIFCPTGQGGTLSPMSVLGSIVVCNAGVLAALVISQLKREGAPYLAIGWAGEALDMRTMVDVFAWPDHRAVYSSMMHWYELPMFTLGGCTDAKVCDQQAAAEAALTIMADAVSGGHMIHNIGFMESSFSSSLAQLVLADDMVGWVKAFLKPIEVTDEEMALDVIEEVGPGNMFLKHKHTRRHARDRWQPQVFDRRNHEEWERAGALDATAVAAARVDEILAQPNLDPLPTDVEAAIDAVIEKAEARAVSA